MQPLTDALWAILEAKLQVGDSGHRAVLELGTASTAAGTAAGKWEDFDNRSVTAGTTADGSSVSGRMGTVSGECLTWVERVAVNTTGVAPERSISGGEFYYSHIAVSGTTSVSYIAYVTADDQFWSDYDFDVLVRFEMPVAAAANYFGLQLGDIVGGANGQLYDGNMATAYWVDGDLKVGNRLTDAGVETLSFDLVGAGPCFLRWQHSATLSRAKIWRDGEDEPAWGDPDTTSRSDVGDDGITGNMFAFFINHYTATAGQAYEVVIDYIDDGASHDGCSTAFTWTPYQVIAASVDKSYGAESDALTVVIDNSAGDFEALAETPLIDVDRPLRLWQWYGDADNAVCTFLGLADSIGDHRHPHLLTIRAKDRYKLLLNESVIVTDPQEADATGAVRTPDNYVWLNTQAVDIINDLLDKAGWPSASRDITDIDFLVDEFIAALGDSHAGAIRNVCNAIVFEPWVDEAGVFQCHPRPSVLTGVDSDTPVEAVASFSGANEVTVIDAGLDDQGLATRVYAFGPAGTDPQETWTEVWHTNAVNQPNGLWHRPSEPTKLYIIDGKTRKIYRIDQTTFARTTLSAVLSSHALTGGMDGDDPASENYVYVLETPFNDNEIGLPASSAHCRVLKVSTSTWTVTDNFSLGAGIYTAIRCTSSYIYVTRYDNETIKKFKKSGAFGDLVTTVDISTIGKPTGLAIDGTDLWIFHGGTISVVAEASPTVVITTHPAPGTAGGGEIDSVDNSYLYADNPGGGTVYKYQLEIPGTPAVTGQAIDYTLEDALGARAGVEPRSHVGCPNDSDPHPYEIRLAPTITDDKLTTSTMATETANRLLARLSRRNRKVQIGVIANPGIQKGDPIEVHDPPSGLDHQLMMVESYTTNQEGATYLGVISGPLWSTDY